MSKEPIKREVEVEPTEQEGWKHGYSEQQIKIMEEARGEPKMPKEVEEEGRRDQKHK